MMRHGGRPPAPLQSGGGHNGAMKLLFFDDFQFGILTGDAVVDVTDVVQDFPHTSPQDLIAGVIARFEDYRSRLEEAARRGPGTPLDRVRVRPPLPKPTNIV